MTDGQQPITFAAYDNDRRTARPDRCVLPMVEMAESTFGRVAVNDGKLVARLRAGKTINLNTLSKIEMALNKPVEVAA